MSSFLFPAALVGFGGKVLRSSIRAADKIYASFERAEYERIHINET